MNTTETCAKPPTTPRVAADRVLLAEDDDVLRRCLAARLVSRGIKVTLVANGWEALDRIDCGSWDVVVCDIRLPGPSGLELSWRARSLSRPPKMILITAYPEWKVYDEAASAGVLHVLRKPFDLDEFADLVERVAHARAADPEGGPPQV